MPAPIKVCPNCGQSTTLDIPVCSACGHRYRTQFDTAAGPTQAYTPSPSPRSSFGAASSAPAGPASPQPPTPAAPPPPQASYPQQPQPPYAPPQSYPQQTYPPQPYAPPYPQTGYAPPAYRPPAPPPIAMYSPALPYVYPPDDFEMFDLTRQYRDSKKLYWWMLILGLFVFWPLLFVAYSEHKKMNAIKSRVALRGIDPEYWSRPL